jgi:hypothetical protein
VDALFHPYLPPQMLDARTSGEAGPFESDQGLEELCGSCGARDLRSQHLALAVRFRDALRRAVAGSPAEHPGV